jgi:ubiquinone/menaquinone biosynthesis C-methylase UbiE
MMQRIPEVELMEGTEQAQAYAEADFDEANSLFVDNFQQRFGNYLQGRGLDLGCGPADIVCRLAEFNPDMKFDAVDGSAAMLTWAEQRIREQGLSDKISLLQCHLPCHDLPLERYTVITSNSLLHHMSKPHDFWQMIAHYSEAGTKVMVMDLLRLGKSICGRCARNTAQ